MGRIGNREGAKRYRSEGPRAPHERRRAFQIEPQLAPRTSIPNRDEAAARGAAAISLECSRHGAIPFQRLFAPLARALRARFRLSSSSRAFGGFAPSSAPCLSEA